eukprot:TRINITY_DN24965_c0_g1_i2.p3 TRINITY_DN24965_c0_g1~~TRINITY_DN24965_c0_g1_i2.p3  ORF type:complete len:132 (-),score=13.94 TRINITY_DN24965_c0_g1_i2:35-430(-)
MVWSLFFFNESASTEIYTRSIVGSVRCVQETASNNNAEDYCVPAIFCNKKAGGDGCMDPKECYSECCVGLQCKSAEFCFDRYITPIVNGAAISLILLVVCIASCCYACRLSSKQRRMEEEMEQITRRLARL